MPKDKRNIIIVGAGVAGLTQAVALMREKPDLKVTVISPKDDDKNFKHRASTALIVPQVFEQLQELLDDDIYQTLIENDIEQCQNLFLDFFGVEALLDFKDKNKFVACDPQFRINDALEEQAIKLGIEFVDASVDTIRTDGEYRSVGYTPNQTDESKGANGKVFSLDADLVLIANGINSQLSNDLGMTPTKIDTPFEYKWITFDMPEQLSEDLTVPFVARVGKSKDEPSVQIGCYPGADKKLVVYIAVDKGRNISIDDAIHDPRIPSNMRDFLQENVPDTRPEINKNCDVSLRLENWPEGVFPIGDTMVSLNPRTGDGIRLAMLNACGIAKVIMLEGGVATIPEQSINRIKFLAANMALTSTNSPFAVAWPRQDELGFAASLGDNPQARGVLLSAFMTTGVDVDGINDKYDSGELQATLQPLIDTASHASGDPEASAKLNVLLARVFKDFNFGLTTDPIKAQLGIY